MCASKAFFRLFIPLAVAFAVTGCATSFDATQVNNEWSMSVPAEHNDSAIHDIVLVSARNRGWEVVSDTPGSLELHYKGQFAAVTYATTYVKIRQTGGNRNVMGWVTGLGLEIRKNFSQNGLGTPGNVGGGRTSDGLSF